MGIEATTPSGSRGRAEWLRGKAHEHPVVKELVARLPAFRGPQAAHEAGLYADAEESPSVTVRREVRVSIARLFSVNGTDIQLVGQVQATAAIGEGEQWTLRFYIHHPTQFLTKEVHDADAWWLGVLERHYGRGGPPVALTEPVTA